MKKASQANASNGKQVQAFDSGYLRALDDLPILMRRSGLDAKCDFFNQSWLLFTGRRLEEELGDGWLIGIHPEDVERCVKTHRECFQHQQPMEMEYRLRHHSGEYRWVLDTARPYQDAEGNFAGYLVTCFDLSERKQMEKALVETNRVLESTNLALRESGAMFKGLFEYAPDAIVAVDQQGKILYTNQQTEMLFGYHRAEMVGKPVEILMPSAFHEAHRRHVSGYIEKPRVRGMGKSLALFGQRKDGTRFPVDINLGPLKADDNLVVLATIRDTTEQKSAEEAIREREKLLTTAVAFAPIAFFKIDRTGQIPFFLGRNLNSDQNPLGRSIYELYQDVPGMIESFQQALAGETFTRIIEASSQILEVSFAPLQNEQGEINAVVGVASDITRHRMVEEALRESEAHFRTIFQDAVLGIVLVDNDGQIVEANPAMQEKIGFSAEVLTRMQFLELVHPEDIPLVGKLLEPMLRGETEHFRVDLRLAGASQNILMVRLAMSLFRSQDGTPTYGIAMVENITAQKQAEAELAELHRRLSDSAEGERLHLSQELHDGPLQDLQAISFRLSTLEGLVQEETGQQEIDALQAEMRKVLHSLRAISGELRPPALAPFGLEKAIRSHAEHFQEQHPDISIDLDLASDGKSLPERVRLALFRIYQQSLTNILRHAQAKNIRVVFQLNVDTIELRVEDDGRGFKVPGRWIDLVRQGHFGLVGSMERAESIGGKLEVQSSLGKGTLIRVTVPRREEEQIPSRERFSASVTQVR